MWIHLSGPLPTIGRGALCQEGRLVNEKAARVAVDQGPKLQTTKPTMNVR